MTVEFNVATVLAAAGIWQGQAEHLHGAVTNLQQVVPEAVGERARGALAAFSTHWAQRLGAMETTASGYSAGLHDAVTGLIFVDESRSDELGGLLEYTA